ncbi:hypothetical protein DFH08DRAFT_821638 [Mycena albidolilacea]|uniref:Uncharacterized protein n=1 Tax=Mycena albidolilacea TaxID=1033008 RepID=A0AAD7ED50_9AGAR|nr:hypothetical protein DFH08DRAFT_821638 [Mycena albidolilacea]
MAPGRGRPAKRKPNTSGLQNQKPRTPAPEPEPALAEPEYSPDWPTDLASDDESEEEEANLAFEDGMKSKAASDVDIDSDVEVEDDQDTFSLATEALDDEVLLEKLLSQSEKVGEDADDEEWVPSRVRYQRQRRKEERTARGKYKKGPDVASKSSRTQRHYRDSIAKQTKLNFTNHPGSRTSDGLHEPLSTIETAAVSDGSAMSGIEEDLPNLLDDDSRSEASAMSIDGSANSAAGSDSDLPPDHALPPSRPEDDVMHEWELEAEYETLIFGGVDEIRD